MRRRSALALAVAASAALAAAVPAAAQPRGAAIALTAERRVIPPGQSAPLTVELVDAGGRPVAAERDLEVTLSGGEGLVEAAAVTLSAGESRAVVTLTPRRPGAWDLTATAPGLAAGEVRVLAPAPPPAPSAAARRSVAVAAPAPAPPPPPPEPPPDATATASPRPRIRPEISRGATVRPQSARPADGGSAAAAPSPGRTIEVDAGALADRNVAAVVESLADPDFEPRQQRADFTPEMLALRGRLAEAVESASRTSGATPSIHLTWAAGEGTGGAGSPQLYRIAGLPGLTRPLEVLTGSGSEDPDTPTAPAEVTALEAGEVRLVARPRDPRRPHDGRWDDVEIFAEWWSGSGDDARPTLRASPLDVRLYLANFAAEPELTPAPPLTIAAGGVEASTALRSRRAQTVELEAGWGARKSPPLEVRFLPPAPAALVFRGLPRVVRGLGPVTRTAVVALIDDRGEPARAAEPVRVRVRWVSPGADGSAEAELPAGEDSVPVAIGLDDPGDYRLTASAPGAPDLEPADLPLEYGIAWSLVAVAVIGGLLGAVGRNVLRRNKRWLRAVVLGLLAAVLTGLLAVFGLLDLLSGAIPGIPEVAERVPVATVLGMLLLSLVAGLAGEEVVHRFAGRKSA